MKLKNIFTATMFIKQFPSLINVLEILLNSFISPLQICQIFYVHRESNDEYYVFNQMKSIRWDSAESLDVTAEARK
jgi:hypothetical protein